LVKKINIEEVEEARNVNKDKSFETECCVIRNTLISTQRGNEKLKETYMKKKKLINESVNGFINILTIIDTIPEFGRQMCRLPEHSFYDTESIQMDYKDT
jgi:hypothetical protein